MKTCWRASRDWTEATVLGLGWSSGIQGKSMYRRRLEPSLGESRVRIA